MDPNNLSGFDPRVQDQLAQLSLNQARRTSSQSSQSNVSQASSYYSTQSTQIHPRAQRYPRGARNNGFYQPQVLPGSEEFPALGSATPNRNMAATYYTQPQPQYGSQYQSAGRQSAAQEFFSRARGRGRGRGNGPVSSRPPATGPNEWSRPAPANGPQLYNPHAQPTYLSPEQQRVSNSKLMDQVDYLNAVSTAGYSNMLSAEEIRAKRAFAERLKTIARGVVQTSDEFAASTEQLKVDLEAYGSLANSFGTTGCDVDLLLTISLQQGQYIDISETTKRDLEKALLDQGVGGRLLVNTRIPILKVCESPGAGLLHNLRQHRLNWENEASKAPMSDNAAPPPNLTDVQKSLQADAAAKLDPAAADVALPASPILNHADLEFTGDCGIQCDINFTNHVALVNSRLLWTYGQLDPRVRLMGIFIKNWAKARDINTPYRGTLSSYGYILLVLHYLMNVAHPAVIPNLQQLEKDHDWNQNPQLVEGLDIRYAKDLREIKQYMSGAPQNKSSVGGLLVGFFKYYGTTQGGSFRWNEQVVSIRTPGGIMSKQNKGWTKAKWSDENPNVRQRYLLAIEDPFEIDHNVGRTIGHHGLVAIRDELRRAWALIDAVKRVNAPQGPIWVNDRTGTDVELKISDFMERVESREDTLRKDADERKAKARQMREDLEQKEDLAKRQMLDAYLASDKGNFDENGMWYQLFPDDVDQTYDVIETVMLIHNQLHQDEKMTRMRGGSTRQRNLDEDGEDTFDDKRRFGEKSAVRQVMYSQDTATEETVGNSNITNSETSPHQDEAVQAQKHQVDKQSSAVIQPQPIQKWQIEVRQPSSVNLNERDLALDQDVMDNGSEVDLRQPSHVYHQYTKPQGDNAVGENIQWTKSCKAGLWLSKRDEMIRAGHYMPPTANDLGRLNTRFPYDPSMTEQQLSKLNQILESQYRTTMYPKMPMEEQERVMQAEKVLVDVSNQSHQPWNSPKPVSQQRSRPDIRSWPVRGDIPWSGQTETGRWLLWRDRKLRQGAGIGNGKRHNGLAQRLNELFPFEVRHTLANIERMNEELDTHFHDLVYPRPVSQGMSLEEGDLYAVDIHAAIDKTIRDRQAQRYATQNNEDRAVFGTVYPEPRKVRFAEAPETPMSGIDSTNLALDDHADIAKDLWPQETDVGRWLSSRDNNISTGRWQYSRLDEGSIFFLLDELYPYQANPDLTKREAQNTEIRAFFRYIHLPIGQRSAISAEQAYKAAFKVQLQRKQTAEDNRIGGLLDHFRDSTMKSLSQAQNASIQSKKILDPREIYNRAVQLPITTQETKQQSTAQLAETAVQSAETTENLTPVEAVNGQVTDFVRQRRLAFFQNQSSELNTADDGIVREPATNEKPADTEEPLGMEEPAFNISAFAMDENQKRQYRSNTEFSKRKDSAAEGSWNLSPYSSQGSPDTFDPFVDYANLDKSHYLSETTKSRLAKQLTPILQMPNHLHQSMAQTPEPALSTKKIQPLYSNKSELTKNTMQSSVQTTHSGKCCSSTNTESACNSESVDELVPASLDPNSWRENKSARFENPHIIPIIQAIDFQLDPLQLADIIAIQNGGNGCVRGKSPYVHESVDLHSWGGGGAMAQLTNSIHWSWSVKAPSEDTEVLEQRRVLLEELPTIVEL